MDTEAARKAVIRDAAQLGWVLSELRAVNGSTQQETADAVGMDRTQIAHLEAGRSGRYLTNLLELLEHLGGSFVVEWNVPQPATQTVEPSAEQTASKTPLVVVGGPIRRTTGPMRKQAEAMQRSMEPMRKQAEAMQRALAPMLAQVEAMRRASSLPSVEEPDEEAP